MYNLIVTGLEGAWDGKPYRLELGRFGEYTGEAIATKYSALDQAAIAELQSFPTLFAYEHGHNSDARIGFIHRITSRSGQIQIDYAFYPDLPPISASQLTAFSWELDIAKYDESHSLGRQAR